jgi:hypothetical protein
MTDEWTEADEPEACIYCGRRIARPDHSTPEGDVCERCAEQKRLESACSMGGFVVVRSEDLRSALSELRLWRTIIDQFVDVITPYTEPKGLNSNPGGLSVLLEDLTDRLQSLRAGR